MPQYHHDLLRLLRYYPSSGPSYLPSYCIPLLSLRILNHYIRKATPQCPPLRVQSLPTQCQKYSMRFIHSSPAAVPQLSHGQPRIVSSLPCSFHSPHDTIHSSFSTPDVAPIRLYLPRSSSVVLFFPVVKGTVYNLVPLRVFPFRFSVHLHPAQCIILPRLAPPCSVPIPTPCPPRHALHVLPKLRGCSRNCSSQGNFG